ncbi:MAG: hypothetical protein ACREGI_00145, partial [Candidatus Levyibacteriota bacterium]
MEESSVLSKQEVVDQEKKPQQSLPKKYLWIIFVCCFLFLCLAVISWFIVRHMQGNAGTAALQKGFENTMHSANQMQSNDDFVREYGKDCSGDGTKTFTVAPMKISDIGALIPMGLMVDAHVTPIDHLYFSPKDFHGPRDEYPVFAIANGAIVAIQHRTNFVGSSNMSPNGKTDEYRIVIQYSCTFYSYYDLLTSLSPSIKSQAGNIDDRSNSGALHIPITQGEEIGRIGGQTLDFAIW